MSKPEFSIPVRDLDAAGKPFEFAVRSGWLRGALEGTDIGAGSKDGHLEVRLSKSGTDVVIRGAFEAHVLAQCARCLEPVGLVVKEPLSVLAVPATAVRESAGAKDDDDLSPEQADLIPYDGETVVLDDLVRDAILLGIPMIPLCSEACPGISPQPPVEAAPPDEGIDPRLRPLLRLKKSTP